MTGLVLYHDARARGFEPFALTRPVSEMRAGAELIRRRWERALGAPATAFVGGRLLDDFEELDAPPAARTTPTAGMIIANARFAPRLVRAGDADVWIADGRVAAVRLAKPIALGELTDGTRGLDELATGARQAAIEGVWLDEVWDFTRHLVAQLSDDIGAIVSTRAAPATPEGAIVIGNHAVHVEDGARIEPLVVFDVSAGPVMVCRGASVAAFTRLVGPCIIGEGTLVLGGRIAQSSIGEHCRVHGELSTTIFLGHANKAHDGFVGHSLLGRWVNLGAGTITSNLKNTYGSVALWTPSGVRETGLQFLGTLLGDHAKTAIGTRLSTGTVIGSGANVFGDRMPEKVVRPFAWGAAPDAPAYDLDRFLLVAERVMSRRHVTLGAGGRRQLGAAYARRGDGVA